MQPNRSLRPKVEKEETWWEVGAARGLFTGPWVLCEDLNTVRYPSEKFKLSTLQRIVSDHSALMLQCGEWGSTKSYFKFENWWLTTEGFNDRVKGWLGSFHFQGEPDFVPVAKLRALKEKLKEWSKTSQGKI